MIIHARHRAAADALAQHLAMFPESMACEDLWENHPDLSEQDAIEAGELALILATEMREAVLGICAAIEAG